MKQPYAIFFKLFIAGISACTLVSTSSCNTDSDAIPQIPDSNCLISRIDYNKDHYELREYDSTGHLESIANYWEGAIARTNYTWNEVLNSYTIENFQEVIPAGYEGPLVTSPTTGIIQFDDQERWIATTFTSKMNTNLFATYTPEYNKEGKISKLTYVSNFSGTTIQNITSFEYSNGNLIKTINGGLTTYFEYYADKVAHPTNLLFLFDEDVYSLLSKNLPKMKTEVYAYNNGTSTVTRYSYQYNDKGLPTEANILLEYNYPDDTDTVSYTYTYSYRCF